MLLAIFGNGLTWPMINDRRFDNFATMQDVPVYLSKPDNITWYSTATSPAHSLLSASTAFYLMKLSPPTKKS